MTIMTAPGAPTIAYRANTTAHDSDTIAMPGKYDHHDSDMIAMPGKARPPTTLIRSQCRARPDGISSVSRADASRFIAPGITTPHARHRVAARQASARPTPCDASGQPTVVIISPPELGGVRGGLNRRRGSLPKTGGDGGVSLALVQTTPPSGLPS